VIVGTKKQTTYRVSYLCELEKTKLAAIVKPPFMKSNYEVNTEESESTCNNRVSSSLRLPDSEINLKP
jgi:hypothetical protein